MWASCFPGGTDGKVSTGNVEDLDCKDAVEEGMEIHTNILAWKVPMDTGPGGQQSMGLQRAGKDWVTKHSTAQCSVLSDSLQPCGL